MAVSGGETAAMVIGVDGVERRGIAEEGSADGIGAAAEIVGDS